MRAKPPAIRATVKTNGQQREKRFPLDTQPHIIEAWKRSTWAKLELGMATSEKPSSSLSADIDRYLSLQPEGPAKTDLAMLLRHWRVLGDQPRKSLTGPDIYAQMLAWHRDGAAPQTCNHRRRALVGLYRTLDGPTAPNPAKDAQKLRVPRAAPRGLPWAVVLHLLKFLPDTVTGDRIRVLALTGWPHAVLGRIELGDLHLAGKDPHAFVRPRRKGAGRPATLYPLTPQAVAALRKLVKRQGLGPFSRSSLHKSFRIVVRNAKAAWKGRWLAPENLQPYDLRRAVLSRVYALTSDIEAAQALGLHSNKSTTAIYIGAEMPRAARAARDALARKS